MNAVDRQANLSRRDPFVPPLGHLRLAADPPATIHPTAEVHSLRVGLATTIWQYCVVLSGARIGAHCNINSHCFVEDEVVVGDHVTVKCGVQLWNGVTLEDHVFVGPNVTFTNDLYPRSKAFQSQPVPTLVRCGASIGANTTIVRGVTIGRDVLIDAGSVVTRDVPDGELWFGNPARRRGRAPDARRTGQAELPDV